MDTRSTKHQTRFLAGKQEFGVNVVITFPEPTGGELGLAFECDQPLDERVEEAVIAKTRSMINRTLAANGGLPDGGVLVIVAVEIPHALLHQVAPTLHSVVSHVAAENLRTSLAALTSSWAVEA